MDSQTAANDRAISLARDLAEVSMARKICIDVLRSVADIPMEQQLQAADSRLQKRLLHEMLDYKDRLTQHVETLLKSSMKELEANRG